VQRRPFEIALGKWVAMQEAVCYEGLEEMDWEMIVHCTVHGTLYCTPYIEHRTLNTVHCTPDIVHRILYTGHCTPYIVHRILYTVHIIPPDAGQHCSLHKHTNTNATTARFVVFIGGGGVSRNACCVRIPQLVTAYTGREKFKKG
jgi:hypothetical protein